MMKHVFLILASAFICGCQTTNTTGRSSAQPSSSSTFVHAFTMFSFPVSVGTFHRVNVQEYDREGKDIGVGYNSSTPIAATVFVYPGPKDFAFYPSPKLENLSESLIASHFETCKQDVFRAHANAKLTSEETFTLIQGKDQFKGIRAVFSLDYQFGLVKRESVSELYVFLIEPSVKFLVTSRYFVTYRISYPVDKKAEAGTEIAALMADLSWPTK
jgi:hypothetical protein